MSPFFEDHTIQLLNEELAKDDVKTRKGTGSQKLSYIASYHAINEANRIFGFGNWSTEIMHIHQADRMTYEKPGYKVDDAPKEMISICYTCHLKLTVRSGDNIVSHEDTGFGNGVAGHTAHGIGSCIELATKEAVTDALKRCLRYYGNKFGLSLYDKDVVLLGSEDIEAAKTVTEPQLKELRDLYERRGVSDEWVLAAIKAEGYPFNDLEIMRQDWFLRALQITTEYKAGEIEREDYSEDIERVLKMLAESATKGMLIALFREAWEKTGKYEDEENRAKAKKIYDRLKPILEDIK